MIASPDENAPVKLIDFSAAIEVPDCGYVRIERAGRASYYMAPEILKEDKIGYEVDIWGCGKNNIAQIIILENRVV